MIYVLLLFIGLCNQFTHAKHGKIVRQITLENWVLGNLPKHVPKLILQSLSPVQKIQWSPDNIHIATYASNELVIKIWNVETGAQVESIGGPKKIKDFGWSPDGKRFAITSHDSQVAIYDLNKVFEMEKAIQLLRPDQLAFMELFIGQKALKKLDEEQRKMFEELPDIFKESLNSRLQFNIRNR